MRRPGRGCARSSGRALVAVAWGKEGRVLCAKQPQALRTPLLCDTREPHASVPCTALRRPPHPGPNLARPGRRAAVRAPLWGQPPLSSPGRANFPNDNRSGFPRGLRKVGAPLSLCKNPLKIWRPRTSFLGPRKASLQIPPDPRRREISAPEGRGRRREAAALGPNPALALRPALSLNGPRPAAGC